MSSLFPAAPAGPWLYMPRKATGICSSFDMLAEVQPDRAQTTMYGKTFPVPRLEAWFGLGTYAYGGQRREPRDMAECPLVETMRGLAEEVAGVRYNSCFVNAYETERDCIAWHADDEEWIGEPIVSITLGSIRRFAIRRKSDHKVVETLGLGHGDVLLMREGMQAEYEHCVRRQKAATQLRVNLTFRIDRRHS